MRLLLGRDGRDDLGSVLQATDCEPPAEPFDAVAHAQQSDPMGFFKVMLQRNAHAIIAHAQFQHSPALRQSNLHMQRSGMAVNVEQRFLSDPE